MVFCLSLHVPRPSPLTSHVAGAGHWARPQEGANPASALVYWGPRLPPLLGHLRRAASRCPVLSWSEVRLCGRSTGHQPLTLAHIPCWRLETLTVPLPGSLWLGVTMCSGLGLRDVQERFRNRVSCLARRERGIYGEVFSLASLFASCFGRRSVKV